MSVKFYSPITYIMSGSPNVDTNVTKRHFPHLKSIVDLEKAVTPAFKGLYRFKKPEHAVTTGHIREVTRELVPKDTVASTFFSQTNNYVDFVIPKDTQYVDQIDLAVTADISGQFDSCPHNLFTHLEVREGQSVKETVYSHDLHLNRFFYPDTLEQKAASTATYTTVSGGEPLSTLFATNDDPEIRIPVRCVLNSCGVPVSELDKDVTLRCYSRVYSDVLTAASDAPTVESIKCTVREAHGNDQIVRQVAGKNLDWRYLQPKYDEKVMSFTSGTQTNWKLQAFDEDDLISHMFVLIRASSLSGSARDTMQDIATKIWLEDESGQNLTNGIQWTSSKLRYVAWPDKFSSDLNINQSPYLVLCPAFDPVGDYKNGTVTGAHPLRKNMKLQIIPNATGSYTVTVIAMCHKHVRLANGELAIQ